MKTKPSLCAQAEARAQELFETWTNGNRKDVAAEMANGRVTWPSVRWHSVLAIQLARLLSPADQTTLCSLIQKLAEAKVKP